MACQNSLPRELPHEIVNRTFKGPCPRSYQIQNKIPNQCHITYTYLIGKAMIH